MDFTHLVIDDSFIQGERSRIRRVRIDDPEEMRRMRVIEDDPGVAAYMEGLQATDEDLISFAQSGQRKLLVGVTGLAGIVDQEEVDKLQGWIYFYPDEEERVSRLKNSNLRGYLEGASIIEISYAKYPGAIGGQMSSAIRQILKLFDREYRRLGEKVYITAYTDKNNQNSSRLLEATGFFKVGEIEYHPDSGVKDELWMLRLGNFTPLR